MRMCMRYLESVRAFLSDEIGRCNTEGLGRMHLSKLQGKCKDDEAIVVVCRTDAVE